tara:strand:- start:527 stop:1282 length:756 start_codon:yes stop_codon:yes gene_type:complete
MSDIVKVQIWVTNDGSEFLTEEEAQQYEDRLQTVTVTNKETNILERSIINTSDRIWYKYPFFGMITNSDSSYEDTPAYTAFDSYFLDNADVTLKTYDSAFKGTNLFYPAILPPTTVILEGSFTTTTIHFNTAEISPTSPINYRFTTNSTDGEWAIALVQPHLGTTFDPRSPQQGVIGNLSGSTTEWGYNLPVYQVRKNDRSLVGNYGSKTIFLCSVLGVNGKDFTASTEMENISDIGSVYYGKTCFMSYSG